MNKLGPCLKWLTTLLVTLLSWPGGAAITFISASGYSNLDTTTSQPIIYAGLAGSELDCATPLNSDGTCNNCPTVAGVFRACNPARVMSSTELTINFKSSTATGYPAVTGSTITDGYFKGATSVSAGNEASITFDWFSLCNKLESGSDCGVTQSATIRIGIDADNNGMLDGSDDDQTTISIVISSSISDDTGDISDTHVGPYQFKAQAGDSKVYLPANQMVAGTGFPNSADGVRYSSVLVFYASGTSTPSAAGFNDINISGMASNYVTLNISENNSQFILSPDQIGGLTNDIYYYFRLAVKDVAGNIGYFTTDLNDVSVNAAMPSQVIGLLEQDLNCFIATAAFGSPFESKVADFRKFRDQYLKKSTVGQKFIAWYYNIGPSVAAWIAPYPIARALTRALLFPLWLFIKICLASSLVVAALLLSATFIISCWLWRRAQFSLSKVRQRAP